MKDMNNTEKHIEKFDTDIVIGLEIHVTLNTKSKLFCSCPNLKSDIPNKNVCPICLGHPGSKPIFNKSVLNKAIQLALALNCDISPRLVFSRKTYFYPDNAKNFQITQYEEPIGNGGFVIVNNRKINLERIHIEEDPGSLVHNDDNVLIDYNRSGSPLCEIVTKPEITSAKEAREFIKKLMIIIDYLDVFDINNGVIKADLNISIRESGYIRVEIKGISGLKDVEDALLYEIARQKESPREIICETRGFDTISRITFSQRRKEEESDYGYIYEPDIVPRIISDEFVSSIKNEMPILVDDRIKNYISKGIKEEDAIILASMKEVSNSFDKSIMKGSRIDSTVKFFKRDIISMLNNDSLKLEYLSKSNVVDQIIVIINHLDCKNIIDKTGSELIRLLAKNDSFDVKKYISDNNLFVKNDIDIDKICEKIILDNKKAVDDYYLGKEISINFLVGQVMKLTKGQVLPDDVKIKIKIMLDDNK